MQIRKKMLLLTVLCFCVSAAVFSQEAYNNFLKFKIGFYNAESKEAIQTRIEAYRKKIEASNLTEEEKLTLFTLLAVEQTDMAGKANAKQNYRLLTEQDDRCKAFMEGKKDSEVNVWLLVGWADIKSRLAGFLSGQMLYDEALRSRHLYEEALKQNKKFSQGHLSYGLWLFFAPPIAGGGTDAALKAFSKAVSCANTPEEKYLALLYRSQAYIAVENPKKAAADLRAAHDLFPKETFTQLVSEGNKNGKLFFE